MVLSHDVFISYSTRDRERAEAACAALERDGIACWIAPRDGEPGVAYAHSLVEAISSSRIVVLIFSGAANASEAVLNELEIAANRGIAVLPVRIEPHEPHGAAEFYLRRRHWLDAYDDFELALARLPPAVRAAVAGRTAVRAPAAPRQRNLPRQGTSFIGRTNELKHVIALLAEAQIVTVAGPGGVGKTRLALQAALEAPGLGDDVWFVDLAPLTDEGGVPATILAAIGATGGGDATPLEQVVATLGQRHAALVLDNCEHVVAGAAAAVRAIAAGCPNVAILGTSREALNVAGERVYRLAPFDLPTAVRLFAERAAAANPLFELRPSNAVTIEAICNRLDGLALAIELAAARVRVISVDELASRLNERFRILTGGRRDALPHQQTLRALIDWSYDLLSADESALFRRIAVFGGSFTLDGVTTVAGFDPIDPWAVLDVLASLVDKSLVIAEIEDAGQRYHMLQSIHDYARERLAGDEARDVSRRHAEYFAKFARAAYDEFDGAPAPDWLARMRVEIDNLRAALSWSTGGGDVALGLRLAADSVPIFLRLALLSEGLSWCERALAAGTPDPHVEARLRYGMSMLHNNRVALSAAAADARRSVELYRTTSDARGLVRALSQQAQQDARQGHDEVALEIAQEALAGARDIGDARLLAATLQRCAIVFRPDAIEKARPQFAESVALFRGLGRDDETARALVWWSRAEIYAGELERGLELAEEASAYATGDQRIFTANTIATCALALGDAPRAEPAAREALRLAATVHNGRVAASAIDYLAAIIAPRDPERGARLFGYAQARLAERQWRPDNTDTIRIARLRAHLLEQLGEARFAVLCAEGAAWSEDRALAAVEG